MGGDSLMALLKPITSTQNGHADNYWRVAVTNTDGRNRIAVIVLSGYRDQAWRDAGGEPNQQREFIARGADFLALAGAAAVGATVFDVIATAAYNYIKTAPRVVNGETLPSEFADAVDV